MASFDSEDELGPELAQLLPVRRLPQETTSFVGRATELDLVAGQVGDHRLVTLVGPGGVGKTRLALRVAARVEASFPDGVVLAELSGVRDPQLLPRTLASLLGVPEADARQPLEAVIGHLRDRKLLLILDTCEHLLSACGAVADELLASCDRVQILATSRQPLDTPGESLVRVAPLPITSPLGGDAVELFDQRAEAVVRGFVVDHANREQVVRVCQALDGIPLAIELAAARLRGADLDTLAQRIERRLKTLTGHRNSRVERHSTLRAAIEWSHDLCTGDEKLLWARLSVFAGGFDLEAAERVCGGRGLAHDDVLDTLVGLVDKSIVQRLDDEGVTRYRMLDTIREFGAEVLEASGDTTRMRDLHLDHFLAAAREHGTHWADRDQLARTKALLREHGNLRAALEHATASRDAERAAALSGGLWKYWHLVARLGEGRHWQTAVLELLPEPSTERCWALITRSHLSTFQGFPDQGLADALQALEEAQAIGDTKMEGRARTYLMFAASFGNDPEKAMSVEQRAVELIDGRDSFDGQAVLAAVRGHISNFIGAPELSLELTERSLELLAQAPGTGPGEHWMTGYNRYIRGVAHQVLGNLADSAEEARTCVRLQFALGNDVGIAYPFELLAWLATAAGRFERAAWLLGAADVLWRKGAEHLSNQPYLQSLNADARQRVEEALGAERFQELWRTGASHPLRDTVEAAAGDKDRLSPAESGSRAQSGSRERLTSRELEVATLAARGLTNREIAETFVISKRTVDAHMERILAKLGVTSRQLIGDRLAGESRAG